MKIIHYDDIKGPVGLYDVTDNESRDPEAILREGEFIGNLGNRLICAKYSTHLAYLGVEDISGIREFFKSAIIENGTALFLYLEKIKPWLDEARKEGIESWPNVTSDGLFSSLDEYFKWQTNHRGEI